MIAAMAGLAALSSSYYDNDSSIILKLDRAAAMWACVTDVLQAQNSRLRRIFKEEPRRGEAGAKRQAWRSKTMASETQY
jgi:hypothetical protein